MSAISDYFGITPAAASQLVDKLVQAGYLERTEDSNDRRVRLLNLSTKGGKLLHQATEERYRWMDDLTSKLSPEEQDKIVTALNILIKAARVMEEQK
jgi:DNA-binding MarR family transcriptional regulator